MIKKYLEFIKENISIGEWVEPLMDDEYIRNIVIRFTKDIDPTIDLTNAINVLDRREQAELKTLIDDYLQNGIQEKDPEVIASTETDELMESVIQAQVEQPQPTQIEGEVTPSGKGVFNSFLKSLTALGLKESKPNYESCPENFLIFYLFDNLISADVKSIFNRFKSLLRYDSMIDYGKNEVSLYFGIRCDGQLEYGISYDKLLPIGRFKLSQSTIKWIVQLESKSSQSLKKDLVNLSYNSIMLLGKIKTDMKDFNPGYHEKRSYPTITDNVISFGYKGIGNWNNGKLDENDLLTIKNNFSTWVISKKWGSKVLISIKPSSFWLNIHLKLK
jgi:hypothetical protein